MLEKKQSSIIEDFQIFMNTNTSTGGKVILRPNGDILRSNDENLSFSMLEDTNLLVIFPNSALGFSARDLTKILESNEGIRREVLLQNEGIDAWYQLLISPISRGEIELLLIEFTDITDYKVMEKSAIKQRAGIENEMLLRTKEIVQTDLFTKDHGGFITNFMRGLRHDLLSPVAQLENIIDYYKKTDDPKKKKQAAHHIDESLQKLSNTARGFSDFVDLFILPQNNEATIKIAETFKDAKELLNKEILQTKAQIKDDFEAANTLIFNEKFTASILYNLLSNAIKFHRKDIAPIIEIQTFREDKNFVISVKDNGVGIDLEKHGHELFAPFKRLNMEHPGVGVGLSMIKNTLLKFGGDIQIESTVNEGTMVQVFIPQ